MTFVLIFRLQQMKQPQMIMTTRKRQVKTNQWEITPTTPTTTAQSYTTTKMFLMMRMSVILMMIWMEWMIILRVLPVQHQLSDFPQLLSKRLINCIASSKDLAAQRRHIQKILLINCYFDWWKSFRHLS